MAEFALPGPAMFDFVSRHKRFLQVVLALTLVPFAFFGLESYTRVMRGAGDVANVEGIAVSQRELSDEVRRYLERVREAVGGSPDIAEMDTPELRLAVLESLIAQRLVMAEVIKARLAMPREEVMAAILASPDFQAGGKFAPERYAAYLRTRGLSDEGNVERLRVELPASRIADSVTGTAFVPRAVAERLIALAGERREISHAPIQIEPFLARVKPSESDAKAFYEANLNDYRVPERVRAEFVALSAEEMAAGELASDAEIKAAYDARASQYAAAEQRRASHIMVKTREEADKVLAELRGAPQRFAELAKKQSLDPGSAEQGGDLGLNPQGGLASKALDEAVFRMKQGDTEIVQSEFGFHVLRLNAIQAGKARTLEEARKELAAEVVKQKAAKRFTEAAEGFNNTVYEQSDSLKPAADRYKLKVHATGWITRQPTPEMGPLAHPKLLGALFSADAVKQKRNTDAVEVAPGVLVAARVLEHQPSAQRPFEEVKAEVTRRLALKEASALARKEGAEKLAILQKGGDAAVLWSAPRMVSRREATGLVPQALQKVMAADASRLPAYIGIERGEQGYVIYRVSKVVAAAQKPAAENAQEIALLDRAAGIQEFEAYIAGLRARGKIEINKANLEKK